MGRLPHASPQPPHPPHTVRPWMWSNAKMRAMQGPCARRGGASPRGQSCHGEVGAHRSKERVSAHALRVRWETKGVRTLNQGAIAPRLRTDRQSPEAPCVVGSKPRWVRSDVFARYVSDPSCDPSRSAVFLCHGSRRETIQRAQCARCMVSIHSWIGQGVLAGEGL